MLKHFPGHGHASGDSHEGGVVTPPLAELKANDLIPYQTLTTQAPVAVMVGHMQVPGLTGTDPASLSPAAYGLLRSGGYGGRDWRPSRCAQKCDCCMDRLIVSRAKILQSQRRVARSVVPDKSSAPLAPLDKPLILQRF